MQYLLAVDKTPSDMYLHWDSHHNIPAKYSVIGTLYHRANTICSTTQYLQNEERHLNQALMKCKYPQWAINRVKMRARTTTSHNSNRRTGSSNTAQPNNPNINIVVPYHQGLSESIKRTCKKNMAFRCIAKEDIPSRTSSWLLKTRTIS